MRWCTLEHKLYIHTIHITYQHTIQHTTTDMPPTRLRHIHSLAIHNLHLPQHASTTTTTTATRKVSISNSKLNSDYEDVSQPPSLSTSQNNTTNNNNSNSNKVSWEKFAHSLVVDANLLCDVWFEISCENGHVFRSDVIRKTLVSISYVSYTQKLY